MGGASNGGGGGGFDPARFTGCVDCGMLLAGEGSAAVGVRLEFRLAGDRGGYFVLAMGNARRAFSVAMGAAEWAEFRRIVGEGERVFRKLMETGQCDELTPVPPEV